MKRVNDSKEIKRQDRETNYLDDFDFEKMFEYWFGGK